MNEVLYRKYRPSTFAELLGQERIADTLVNALTSQRVSHAYLFTGSRGTGKTSAGRILAKALNCARLIGGDPCNRCASCKTYNVGNGPDLIEIDAASNRGIDDIKALRDRVSFAAINRTRVYLIDEAHMLTEAAFNALLKILEEPPAHVVFVLATTEAAKIPSTILSRCQRFDFRRAPLDALVANLVRICAGEGISAQKRTLRLLAERAHGSHRDAVSLLDQLSTGTRRLTFEGVRAALGLHTDARAEVLASHVKPGALADGLTLLAQVRDAGADPKQFLRATLTALQPLFQAEPTDKRLRYAVKAFSSIVLRDDSFLPLDIAFAESCLCSEEKMPLPKYTKGYRILKTRARQAEDLLGRMVAELDDDFIMSVAIEIGLDPYVAYNDNGTSLDFDTTDLQTVALASALAACVEYRKRKRA